MKQVILIKVTSDKDLNEEKDKIKEIDEELEEKIINREPKLEKKLERPSIFKLPTNLVFENPKDELYSGNLFERPY